MNPPEHPRPHPQPAHPGITPLGIILMTIFPIVIIALLAGIAAPLVLRSKMRPGLTESLNNSRQLGLALLEFEAEYGRFPDAQTAASVTEHTGSTLAPPGTSANDHLRQLIAAGMILTEIPFYSKAAFTQRPDNRFDTPKTILAPGELGFGYVLNGDTGFEAKNNPSLILLCSPLAFDGKTVSASKFDPDSLEGRMVTLHIDLSARSHFVDPATKDVSIDGKNWLATGDDTIWGSTITPRVAPPEPK
jgi:hypothetical protein